VSSPGRLATTLVLVIGVATLPIDSLRRAELVFLLVALVLTLARPSPRWLVRRLALASLAIFAILVPLFLSAAPSHALAIGYRALATVVIALAASSTIALSDVPRSLRALGLPELYASTIFALVWQLDHIADEARRLVLARRLRGASAIGPGVMTSLLIRTRLRADRVDLAMQLRGATASNALAAARLGPIDALAIASTLGAVVGSHWIR
jgi:energy-coupling factor transporter transmembrane protein EcfT